MYQLDEKRKSKKKGHNGEKHNCASKVKSEEYGIGECIKTMHAEPDENGYVAWYDVLFEHGIEEQVSTESLEILVSESHT
tara:strand:- start:2506 stop:2745 length:240 start_codon:yes stop_codon:yes gene_type:complete